MIVNLYRYKGYIWRGAWADVRHRYAGSGMGVVWNVLQPLALIGVFSLVFTNLIDRAGGREMPEGGFTIYLCSALLPWMAFAECVGRGTNTFVNNAGYLRKLPIPEHVFLAQTALGSLMELGISYLLLMIFAVALSASPHWTWAAVPIPLAMLMGFGFGASLMLGTINVFIRDVAQLVQILMRVGFWTYPVVYQAEMLPDWAQRALPYNPVYPYLEAARNMFLWGEWPSVNLWAGMVAWIMVASIIGYVVLRKLRPELRDAL